MAGEVLVGRVEAGVGARGVALGNGGRDDVVCADVLGADVLGAGLAVAVPSAEATFPGSGGALLVRGLGCDDVVCADVLGADVLGAGLAVAVPSAEATFPGSGGALLVRGLGCDDGAAEGLE